MNDRLKFRVWNKEEKKFEDEDFYLDDEGNLCCDTWDDGLIGAGDNYTVVCCTGLKDKNGKLIYEGDILRHNGKLLIVKYQEEMACFAPQHFYLENDKIIYCGREWFEEYNNEDCKLYTSNSYEVIGNIYMDSHLLDKSNNL